MILWTHNTHFRKPVQARKIFHSKSKFFFQLEFFSEKFIFIPKCFSGHVECSFESPAKNSSLRVRTFFAESLKDYRFSEKKIKFFSGHVDWSLDN